jgi:hypothetical protein
MVAATAVGGNNLKSAACERAALSRLCRKAAYLAPYSIAIKHSDVTQECIFLEAHHAVHASVACMRDYGGRGLQYSYPCHGIPNTPRCIAIELEAASFRPSKSERPAAHLARTPAQ